MPERSEANPFRPSQTYLGKGQKMKTMAKNNTQNQSPTETILDDSHQSNNHISLPLVSIREI
jgi:hypothetical protein